jgi:hypothetical protein
MSVEVIGNASEKVGGKNEKNILPVLLKGAKNLLGLTHRAVG